MLLDVSIEQMMVKAKKNHWICSTGEQFIIRYDGVEALANALRNNTSLTMLSLACLDS